MRYQSVVFDCDSTLSTIEGIDEIAAHRKGEIVALTDAAMRGEVALEDVYGRRLALIQPTRGRIEALGRQYVETLVPDARETVRALMDEGVDVRVISGGLLPAVREVARALAVPDDRVAAVDLRFDDAGAYAGFDETSPLARSGGKLEVLRAWGGELARPAMLVGDGATDLEGRPAVDCFVAFAGVVARDAVIAAAEVVVRAHAGPYLRPRDGRRASSRSDAPCAVRARSRPPRLPDDMTAAPSAPPFGRFFLPGPTEVRPEVLEAMLHPMIGHRGKGMEELIASTQPALRRVFRTERPVYVASSSATGLMEASLRNGARRRVLSLVNGAFSERYFRIAQACGLDADADEIPLGRAHTAERLRDLLKGKDYDAVTVVHSETSTGALAPVHELAQVCHEAGDVVLLVDSVTGIAGAPVETDAWALDFVLTGSQKALALPPGLAFGVAHPRLLERAKQKADRGIYFDLVEFEKYLAKHQTPNTPALSFFYALQAQMAYIDAETIEGRWARHEAMARRTHQWVLEMNGRGLPLSILAPDGFRSPTVTCITVPAPLTGPGVNDAMKKRGYTIAPGYGSLKDSTIRIGHMGDHTVEELDELLGVLAEVMMG